MNEEKASPSSSKMLIRVVIGLWVGVIMGAVLVGVLAFAGIIPFFSSGGSSPSEAPLAKLESGTMAPDFTLPDMDGNSVKLSDFRGKVVVFNYWATWCDPCIEEMPMFEAYHKQYPDLVMLGLDQQESKAKVQAFLAEHELTYPILLDSQADAASKYKVVLLPTTIFVDEKGEVRFRHYGIMSEDQLVYYLTTLGVISQ